jgi:hypothetical protein
MFTETGENAFFPIGRQIMLLMLMIAAALQAGCQKRTCSIPPQSLVPETDPAIFVSPTDVDHFGMMVRRWQLQNLSTIIPTDVVVTSNRATIVNPDNFATVLKNCRPLPPDSEMIRGWHYTDFGGWSATFRVNGRPWSIQVFAGGLGSLGDDQGHLGAFLFDESKLTSDRE